jgi:nanoRNase/pAp phosphatase (c-di-AMP/oligoRNAs hydrolase)
MVKEVIMNSNGHAILELNTETSPGSQPRSGISDVLKAHRGEHHIVVLHNYPDPDAISSGFAHQLISAQFDIQVDVVYRGEISHRQNIAMVRLLGLEPLAYDPSMDLRQYDGAVFVDNQGATAGEILKALEAAGVPPLMVIDHHERQERLEPEFSDIRRVGACATIYATFLEQGLVEMDKSNKEHVVVATALMHGLMTDTDGLVRARAEDFHAASFLSRFKDGDMLGQIMSQVRSRQTMEIIHRALGNRLIVENFSISGIGYLRVEDRDAIPQAADFLLTEDNVHTAIVYGILTGDDREEALVGSVRTSRITLNPDDFIKGAFGKDRDGRYFGGGKESAGGFELPISFLSGGQSEEYRELKWQVFDSQVKQKLLLKIGVEHD